MTWSEIRTVDELVELVGVPLARVADKARPTLHDLDRQWLAVAPFCLIATAGANGTCDVSPKGDPDSWRTCWTSGPSPSRNGRATAGWTATGTCSRIRTSG